MATKKDENFDEDLFETKLEALKDTQIQIQQMSAWCLEKRPHHKKVVQCWLNVFKRSRIEQRLVLFYLANDVIQYSKRKRYEFVESWATALQRATTMVRDERVKNKILRIFKIWNDREIYTEDFITDLRGLLNIQPPKKANDIGDISSDEFSNTKLIASIKECVENGEATDKSLNKVPKLPYSDAEALKHQLKDKTHTEDVEKELERYITYMKLYYKNLQTELKTRAVLLAEISKARKFYRGQLGEVKVVVAAYKNFSQRIKNLQKKLNEITPNLASPIPSPDINAPSPERDADLQLPDDQQSISANVFKNSINGYASYMDGNLPFDINDFKRDEFGVNSSKSSSQPIEVIGSRSDDENFSSGSVPNAEFYKSSAISNYSSSSNIAIPGLNDSLTPLVSSMQSEYTSLARSSSQYGSLISSNSSGYEPNSYANILSAYNTNSSYHNSNSSVSNSGASNIPPPPIPPTPIGMNNSNSNSWNMNAPWSSSNTTVPNSYNPSLGMIDTPISPPRFDRETLSSNVAPVEYIEQTDLTQANDVDHRQLNLAPFSIGSLGLSKEKTRQLDIDHRNLISLTGSPQINDDDKKLWTTGPSGDIDYRTAVSHTLKSIETIPIPSTIDNGISSPNPLMPPPSINLKEITSPHKSSASSSSESQKDDSNARYDPADMVVDMDMSDEDIDDILRDADDRKQQVVVNSYEYTPSTLQSLHEHENSNEHGIQLQTMNKNLGINSHGKTALLETPSEYSPLLPNMWDTSGSMGMNDYNANSTSMSIPPPRMPFSPSGQPQRHQFPPFMRSGINGRGRGWPPHAIRSPYRPPHYGRPMHGGGIGGRGGGPIFNRGGNNGGFRGRRGGNNSWI